MERCPLPAIRRIADFHHVCSVEAMQPRQFNHVLRCRHCHRAATPNQHRLIGLTQCVVGIVRQEQHRQPLAGEATGFLHRPALVAEIQTGSGLVEQHHLRLLRQRAGNQHQLAFEQPHVDVGLCGKCARSVCPQQAGTPGDRD